MSTPASPRSALSPRAEVFVVTSQNDVVSSILKHARVSFADCDAKLGDGGCVEVASAVRKASNKTTWLNLAQQEITASGLRELLGALKSDDSLFHLDLGKNDIGDEGAELLADFIAKNKTLTELYLYECGITETGGKKLEAALAKNKTLKRLDVNDNHISKELKTAIAALVLKGEAR